MVSLTDDCDTFYKALGFMTGLRCSNICREGEDSATSCEVRRCCRERGFYDCHECDDFETYDKLRSLMGGLHTDSNLKNLRAINEMGLEAWIAEVKRHSYWDE